MPILHPKNGEIEEGKINSGNDEKVSKVPKIGTSHVSWVPPNLGILNLLARAVPKICNTRQIREAERQIETLSFTIIDVRSICSLYPSSTYKWI